MSLRWRVAQAAEIRWWNNYLKKKPKTDYLNWKKNYWRQLLDRLSLQLVPGERVLDAGCGPAGIFMVLEQQEVTAIDPLLDRYAQQIAHFDPNDYPKVHFETVALENYQPPQRYQKVFCLNAINHVADLQKSMDRLVSLVDPGGDLIVSIDAHNYVFFKQLFRLLPGDILHPHQYDLPEYEKMLTDRGCQIVQTQLLKKEFFFDYHVIQATRG